MAKSYLELLGTNGALRGWHNGLGIIVAKQPFVLVRWVFLHSEMMRRVGLGVPGDGRSACFGSVTSKVRERLAEAEAQLRAKDRFCSCSTCRRLREQVRKKICSGQVRQSAGVISIDISASCAGGLGGGASEDRSGG